jgi:tetratricopeptide (TPR) repeat protein
VTGTEHYISLLLLCCSATALLCCCWLGVDTDRHRAFHPDEAAVFTVCRDLLLFHPEIWFHPDLRCKIRVVGASWSSACAQFALTLLLVIPYMKSSLPDLTTRQLLEAERSHIFEVRVRQSEVLRQAGNARYKESGIASGPEQSSSSASSSAAIDDSSTDNHLSLAEAVELYQRALYHVDFEESTFNFQLTDAHRSLVRKAKAPLFLNLSRCSLRLGNYRDSISHALSAVKSIDGETDEQLLLATRTKANLLAARANLLLKEYEEAEAILNSTLDKCPDNFEALSMLGQSRKGRHTDRQLQKLSWGGKLGGPPTTKTGSSASAGIASVSIWTNPEVLTASFFAAVAIAALGRIIWKSCF